MEILIENKILVTGVAGFIGSHIAEAYVKKGFFVRGIDNFSNGSLYNIKDLLDYSNFEFLDGDITDFAFCLKITQNIDFVFHEAALGSVPRSINEPLEYTKNNILGMHNMLEASVKNNVNRFIYASSSSVYGNDENLLKRIGNESEVLSPYALSKKIDEELALLYYKLYNLKTVGLRYFNVFGERQKINYVYEAVIPKFINSIINNNKITIFGDGLQKRDFTYVKNVVLANDAAATSDDVAFGYVYNVGCGNSTNINNLCNKLFDITGKRVEICYSEKRKGDVKNSMADISKTITDLHYNPKYFIDEGLRNTVSWYTSSKGDES